MSKQQLSKAQERYYALLNAISDRLDPTGRSMLAQLHMLLMPSAPDGSFDDLGLKLTDLLNGFHHLTAIELCSALMSQCITIAKNRSVSPQVFFFAAMMQWGGEIAAGARLVQQMLEQSMQAQAASKPPGVVN